MSFTVQNQECLICVPQQGTQAFLYSKHVQILAPDVLVLHCKNCEELLTQNIKNKNEIMCR